MHPLDVRIVQTGYQWWDIVPAVVGGIFGAIAGGGPALYLARRASREQTERVEKDRLELERGRAISVFVAFQAIFNSFFSTLLMIEEMLSDSSQVETAFPNQKKIRAIVGIEYEQVISFSGQDLAIFVNANRPDFFQDLEVLARRHAAIMSSLKTYAELKAEYHQFMMSHGQHIVSTDGSIISGVSEEDIGRIRLSEIRMETLISGVIKMFGDNTHFMIRTADEFGPLVKAYIPGAGFIPAFDTSELKLKYGSDSLSLEAERGKPTSSPRT